MDIEKLSKLARVEIGKKESQKLNNDLANILRYVDKLKEAPLDGLREMARAGGARHVRQQSWRAGEPENVWRQDQPREFKDYENLIKAAPHYEKGYVRVRPVK